MNATSSPSPQPVPPAPQVATSQPATPPAAPVQPAQPPVSPPYSNHHKLYVGLTAIILLMLGAIILVVSRKSNSIDNPPPAAALAPSVVVQPTAVPSPTPTDVPWTIFSSGSIGISMQLPGDWKAQNVVETPTATTIEYLSAQNDYRVIILKYKGTEMKDTYTKLVAAGEADIIHRETASGFTDYEKVREASVAGQFAVVATESSDEATESLLITPRSVLFERDEVLYHVKFSKTTKAPGDPLRSIITFDKALDTLTFAAVTPSTAP